MHRQTVRCSATPAPHFWQHSRGSSHRTFGHDANLRAITTEFDDDMQGVVANVSQHYASMVSELLDMLQKTEQSLARVRRNKPADAAAAADGSEMSNIQKISLQLFLDTQVKLSSQPAGHHSAEVTL